MSSMLATEWKSPRIAGEVPAGYDGPLYYRYLTVKHDRGPRALQEYLTWENRKINGVQYAQRFASMDSIFGAKLDFPDMFDADGMLKKEWRGPFKARKKSNFPKKAWRECDGGTVGLVGERARSIIEEIEPDTHLFVPIDLEPSDSEPRRVYIFKIGHGGRGGWCALTPEFNPSQNYFAHIPEKSTTNFLLLDRPKVAGKHLFQCELGGAVFSEALVSRLGDVLCDGVVFVPVGVGR